jgi:hypothetical protein
VDSDGFSFKNSSVQTEKTKIMNEWRWSFRLFWNHWIFSEVPLGFAEGHDFGRATVGHIPIGVESCGFMVQPTSWKQFWTSDSAWLQCIFVDYDVTMLKNHLNSKNQLLWFLPERV